MFVVNLISRFMEAPTELHLRTSKRVLRCLKGTGDYGVVSLSSKKQHVVTLSTTGAEFIAADSCACQAVWLSSKRYIATKLGQH
ncbi:hypothetical protein L3X38_012319 [Prunus dulcis]|uniref:Uncharacterized protein n=1 Tax=Prunus dulcis TaxID=3755 RepID=A0AAD4WLC9_PRUDU|nr:hypothetical protein L3X38_012319 [Prunus dulcis]